MISNLVAISNPPYFDASFLFRGELQRYAAAAVVGVIVGSFLNAVVFRVPRVLERAWQREIQALITGSQPRNDQAPVQTPFHRYGRRSTCSVCGHSFRLWEIIPLLGFLLTGGRCGSCSAWTDPSAPLLETMSGVMAMLSLWRFGPHWQAVFGFGMAATLLALAQIDIHARLLPDVLTLPLLWAGLLVNHAALFATSGQAVCGAAVGYLSLWSMSWLFQRVAGKQGLGHGDFKLFAALGAWLGCQMLPVVLLIATSAGALVGLSMLLGRTIRRDAALPFGPFLAAAALIVLFGRTLPFH